MKGPIEFNFDFASPYSYFMAERLDAIARACGRDVIWRPLILWTVLKMHGLPAPLEHPVDQSAKTMLQACVASAVTKGVWGVPYVLIGDEAFFGADRLPHIARHLRG